MCTRNHTVDNCYFNSQKYRSSQYRDSTLCKPSSLTMWAPEMARKMQIRIWGEEFMKPVFQLQWLEEFRRLVGNFCLCFFKQHFLLVRFSISYIPCPFNNNLSRIRQFYKIIFDTCWTFKLSSKMAQWVQFKILYRNATAHLSKKYKP